jgi:regulator of cell morphogenesis and NO signaling
VNTTINADILIGQLAATNPLATRVFARHQIDYCCGGGRPLGEVCREKGLDIDRVLTEIQSEIADPGFDADRWEQAPLGALIDHIVSRFHDPLREELPRLEAMARKVARVHGDKDPERLAALVSVYLGLKAELEQHMVKEEAILFPMIKRGQGAHTAGPVDVMVHEHAEVGNALRDLRSLTGDYTVPEGACNTWRALWFGLEALEMDLHEHIHLENNILFPRALNA